MSALYGAPTMPLPDRLSFQQRRAIEHTTGLGPVSTCHRFRGARKKHEGGEPHEM